MTIISDPLYGTFDITEPVLRDLLEAPTVLRLHGVLQHGITSLIGVTGPVTRFDHSVGVMLVVRMLGASVEEQAAALLHDVSHTAFSHVIDHVVGSADEQGYHEIHKILFVQRSELPALLTSHGLDWQWILDEDNFSLLEQPLPLLCADRIDYFLRDATGLGVASLEECKAVVDHLVVEDGRILVNDVDAGRWLAYHFILADDASWSNDREVGLYELAAQVIRMGLRRGVISEDDFWRTDAVVWDQLVAGADEAMNAVLALIVPETRFESPADHPEFVVDAKIRSIDPEVIINGTAKRLSEIDPEFAAHRAEYQARKSGPQSFRVLRD